MIITADREPNSLAAVTVPRLVLTALLVVAVTASVFAQTPPAGSPEKRGIGVQTSGSTNTSQSGQAAREAKPELVLQTGYNNFFGATRLVFSPDGRLLATTTFRSSTVKLWETSTGRELRNLSSGTQSGMSMSPFVAFSRDSRLIAAAAGDNSVKIWDVISGREVQTLAGTQGSMTSALTGIFFIAFTPNGNVVTISDAIRVWDTTSGQELRSIAVDTLSTSALLSGGAGAAITPDGNQLAFVLSGGTESPQVKFWDLATGRESRSVNLPDKDFDSVELGFTPDGRLLLAGIVDKRLRLWDLSVKGNERDLTPTTTDFGGFIKFSRDGRLLALAEGYTVKLWDLATLRELPALNAPQGSLSASQARIFANFTDDGKRVATGGFGTPTILWETETAKQLVKLSGRTNMAYEVAFSADGTQLSSGGRTRWDLRTGRGTRLVAAPSDSVFGLPSPDGKSLAIYMMNSNALTILEVPSGRQLQRLVPASSGSVINRVNFSPDGTMVLISYGPDPEQHHQPNSGLVDSENQLKIWDVKSGRELRSIALGVGGSSKAGFSPDGRTLGTLGSMGQISLWDTGSGSRIRDLTSSPLANLGAFGNPGAMTPGSIKSGKINPGAIRSAQMAMPNMADMSAMMTNMMGAMSAGTMGQTVTSLAFSPDGRTLATGGVETKSNFDMAAMMSGAMNPGKKQKNQPPPNPQDFMKNMKVETSGQVRLWDVASGTQIGDLKGHGKGVTEVAFSKDGRLLASGSTDNTIRIWDLATKRELRTLIGHTSNIESIDFSPDARLLASATDDGGTFLWDVNTGEHLLTLISLDDGGEWMVVTPQGLFDGTPVSWSQILWRYDQDTFNVAPIEWFFNEFYYPGLLSDILAGKRPRVAQDVSRKDRRQPVVKLSLPGEPVPATGIASRRVKVRIEVTDAPADKEHPQGTGARDLRLFRNGSLAKVWRGDVLKGQSAVTLEEEITIAAGANALTCYAFNKDNVKSKDAKLPLVGADGLKRSGTAYVIAVGLNEYANPQYNLKYAVADAQSFGDEVRTRQTQVGGFERVEVVPLLNENATKANILLALKRLAGAVEPPSLKAGFLDRVKRAEPEDTVI
ncbi:MAG: hypothetical protein ND895_14870, partial [Pyrinomonadaceae bacterium]|nr:hypothetical protein [Pyrinomonadaceae bacterium]